MWQAKLIAGVGGLLALIGVYFYGVYNGKMACENAHYKLQVAEAKAHEKKMEEAQANDLQAAEKEIRVQSVFRETFREVPKIINNPVYTNVCIDDLGVQQINRAVEAANGRPPTGRTDGDPAGVQQATRGD